jgi:hypothetical protein
VPNRRNIALLPKHNLPFGRGYQVPTSTTPPTIEVRQGFAETVDISEVVTEESEPRIRIKHPCNNRELAREPGVIVV